MHAFSPDFERRIEFVRQAGEDFTQAGQVSYRGVAGRRVFLGPLALVRKMGGSPRETGLS